MYTVLAKTEELHAEQNTSSLKSLAQIIPSLFPPVKLQWEYKLTINHYLNKCHSLARGIRDSRWRGKLKLWSVQNQALTQTDIQNCSHCLRNITGNNCFHPKSPTALQVFSNANIICWDSGSENCGMKPTYLFFITQTGKNTKKTPEMTNKKRR